MEEETTQTNNPLLNQQPDHPPIQKNPPTESTQQETMSYRTMTIIVFILLLLAYPIGVLLMYLWMKWPTWVKIIITVPLILGILIVVRSFLSIGIRSFTNPSTPLPASDCVGACLGDDQCVVNCLNR